MRLLRVQLKYFYFIWGAHYGAGQYLQFSVLSFAMFHINRLVIIFRALASHISLLSLSLLSFLLPI